MHCLTPLCMEFLSITLLQPIGPYFQVGVQYTCHSNILQIRVCMLRFLVIYIECISILVFLSAWSKRLSFLSLCTSLLATGQKII